MTTEEINNLTPDEIERLFELYREECTKTNTTPDLSDFDVWMQER